MLNNKVYETLKWLALIAFPAFGWFYGVIAGIWGLPYQKEVEQTLNATGLLIGVLIGVSTFQYRKQMTSDEIHEITAKEDNDVQ